MLSRRIPWHLKFLILVASALRAFPVAPMTGFRSPSVCWPACACGWLWGRSLTQSCPTGSACSQACGCRPCACSASPRWSPTHPGEALPGIRACARRPVHRQAVPKVGNRWISTIYCIFSDFSITFETACQKVSHTWAPKPCADTQPHGITCERSYVPASGRRSSATGRQACVTTHKAAVAVRTERGNVGVPRLFEDMADESSFGMRPASPPSCQARSTCLFCKSFRRQTRDASAVIHTVARIVLENLND